MEAFWFRQFILRTHPLFFCGRNVVLHVGCGVAKERLVFGKVRPHVYLFSGSLIRLFVATKVQQRLEPAAALMSKTRNLLIKRASNWTANKQHGLVVFFDVFCGNSLSTCLRVIHSEADRFLFICFQKFLFFLPPWNFILFSIALVWERGGRWPRTLGLFIDEVVCWQS